MRLAALSAAILFTASAAASELCVLRCTAPSPAARNNPGHPHCGGSPRPSHEPERAPCGHAHRDEALLSAAPLSKTAPIVALAAGAGSRTARLAPAIAFTPVLPSAESPPIRPSVAVLRL
jgi:hypothetical protein